MKWGTLFRRREFLQIAQVYRLVALAAFHRFHLEASLPPAEADAIDFVIALRQAGDAKMPIGRGNDLLLIAIVPGGLEERCLRFPHLLVTGEADVRGIDMDVNFSFGPIDIGAGRISGNQPPDHRPALSSQRDRSRLPGPKVQPRPLA